MNICACGAPYDPGKGTKRPRIHCPACRVQQRTCETCGSQFKYRPRTRKREGEGRFCSRPCQRGPRSSRTCVICNEPLPGRGRSGGQVTCGRKCGAVWHTFNRWGLAYEWRSLIPWSTCPQCQRPYVNRWNRTHCSDACTYAAAGRVARGVTRTTQCRQCGAGFSYVQGNGKRHLCDPCADANVKAARRKAKSKAGSYNGSSHRKRARHYGVEYEPVNRRVVFDRDGWRCYLCGVKVHEFCGRFDDPRLATIEHVVAMSRGGGHTYANTRCACHRCNSLKSDKDVDYQLTLA